MMLPYTAEIYFQLLAQYTAAYWPAVIAGVLLALAALALAFRPVPRGDRAVGAVLAAFWLWVGAAHQLDHMAMLNFMAPVYGWGWIGQGALFAWVCAVRGKVAFRFAGGVAGWLGLGAVAFAIVGYPAVVAAMGFGAASLPWVGTSPDPTAVFTLGLLAMTAGRVPLYLLIVPLLWAGVAAVSGWLLSLPLDYAVPVATVGGIGLIVLRNRHRQRLG